MLEQIRFWKASDELAHVKQLQLRSFCSGLCSDVFCRNLSPFNSKQHRLRFQIWGCDKEPLLKHAINMPLVVVKSTSNLRLSQDSSANSPRLKTLPLFIQKLDGLQLVVICFSFGKFGFLENPYRSVDPHFRLSIFFGWWAKPPPRYHFLRP